MSAWRPRPRPHRRFRQNYAVCHHEPYDESIFAQEEQPHRALLENRLRRQAKEFGYELVALSAQPETCSLGAKRGQVTDIN
jgi:hypothetical protein